MTRFFLPGIAGANSELPDVSPPELSTTAGNGPLAGQTLNFDLNLVNFDWVTWHQYEWENWVAVDALLNIAIGFLNIRGIWQPNNAYTAGDSVFDPADITKLYLCLANHTSGTDFDVDKPLYWELRTDANPPVTSVFGRIGAVTALEADYAAFYPTLTTYNTDQNAQDTAITANANAITANANAITALVNDLADNYYTETEADNLFVDAAGDTMTGDLQINKVNPAIFLYDTDGTVDNRRTRIMQDDNRVRFSRVNDAGDTYTTLALIDEATITIRNPSGTWASMNASGTLRGTAAIVDEGVFIKDDAVGGIYFRDSSDVEHYNIVHDLPNDNLDVNEDGVGTIARFDTLGTQLPDAITLVTREKGDGRYVRYSGDWSAGTYNPFQSVTHQGSTWLCITTTTDEPTSASSDWIALGGAGGSITIGDAFPTVPAPEDGDLHYKTSEVVGLYVYYDDGDSTQWVQTNGGGQLNGQFLSLTTTETQDVAGTVRFDDDVVVWNTMLVQEYNGGSWCGYGWAHENGFSRYYMGVDPDTDNMWMEIYDGGGNFVRNAFSIGYNSGIFTVYDNLFVNNNILRINEPGGSTDALLYFAHADINHALIYSPPGSDRGLLRINQYNNAGTYLSSATVETVNGISRYTAGDIYATAGVYYGSGGNFGVRLKNNLSGNVSFGDIGHHQLKGGSGPTGVYFEVNNNGNANTWGVNMDFTSDVTTKNAIQPSPVEALDDINTLSPISWTYNAKAPRLQKFVSSNYGEEGLRPEDVQVVMEDDNTMPTVALGFTSEDIKRIAPDAVYEVAGIERIDYRLVVPHCLKAIQQLSQRLEALENA